MIDGISSAVDSWHLGAAPVRPTPSSFSKLLRGRGCDDATAVGLASCRSDLVSLSDSVHSCPMGQSLVIAEYG